MSNNSIKFKILFRSSEVFEFINNEFYLFSICRNDISFKKVRYFRRIQKVFNLVILQTIVFILRAITLLAIRYLVLSILDLYRVPKYFYQ